VSALANSQGGILLIGINTENKTGGTGKEKFEIPKDIDGVNPKILSRETISNILCSNIQPIVPNVEIDQISLSGDLIDNVVYQVRVAKSSLAPHMSDHRYYKRTSTGSVPMEHYEVEDVRGRRKGPDLRAEGVFSSCMISGNVSYQREFECVIRNLSEDSAQFALLRIYLGDGARVICPGGFDVKDIVIPIAMDGWTFKAETMLTFKINAYTGSMPLWGNLPFSTGKGTVLNFDQSAITLGPGSETTIILRMDSPDMKPWFEVRKLSLVNGSVTLGEKVECDLTILHSALG
jgi:hypothetical protein